MLYLEPGLFLSDGIGNTIVNSKKLTGFHSLPFLVLFELYEETKDMWAYPLSWELALIYVDKVPSLLAEREREESICVCSSDMSWALLVFTVLEGGKLSPCIYDGIITLLSCSVDPLDRSRLKLIFFLHYQCLWWEIYYWSDSHSFEGHFSSLEAFRMPQYMSFLHSSCWVLTVPF